MRQYLVSTLNYNIPRKIRELQSWSLRGRTEHIITYQEKLGNYNLLSASEYSELIITYQEKLGNYNSKCNNAQQFQIITYQEK